MDNNKLFGLAFNLPENTFIIVEEARRSIPVPRKWYLDENGVRQVKYQFLLQGQKLVKKKKSAKRIY